MAKELIVILDDRDPPADSVTVALGPVRFSDIIRRRTTMAAELTRLALGAGAARVEHLTTEAACRALVERIRDRGDAAIYLRLPLCLPPLKGTGLAVVVEKARFALETMLASQISGDDAAAILSPADAVAVLSAQGPEARRTILLALRDRAETIVDHARFTDIRNPRNLMLYLSGATEPRQFNEGRSADRVFHKSSADVAKMRAEHAYFAIATPEMQRYLMPSFGFWEEGGRAGYAMEHLAVPDAALQWVHHAFTEEEFGLLLDQVFDFFAVRAEGQANLDRARDQILGKLERRMEAFLASDVGKRTDALLAAGGAHGGLSQMAEQARPLIDRALKATARVPLVLSHGDPCLSNILFDRRIGLMRLIDPRGALTAEDAMMHPLYDIAKLSHSVLGGYDFINNGLVGVAVGEDLRLRIDWSAAAPAWAAPAFRARLAAAGVELAHVRAVELSLFLSMLPLHSDHPQKCLAFALVAGEILDDLGAGG